MPQPLFSVIVPVYKAEHYLHQCVDSILAQSFQDFELILVDDGSPDSCGSICDVYAEKDPRIQVIHKSNGGNVSARLAGYGICSGQYIVHVDSDDYIAADLLSIAEKQITAHGTDAVLFGYVRFDNRSSSQHPQPLPAGLYAGEDIEILRRNLILSDSGGAAVYNCLWSVIMRREIFEPHLLAVPTTLHKGEDLAATAPALNSCSSVYITDTCSYYYRNTPNSIMNTHGDELPQAKILAAYLLERMGEAYRTRLDNYVLRTCYEHLRFYTLDSTRYRKELRAVLDAQLIAHLKNARCGSSAHITDKLVYFLLRHRMFGVFRLISALRR